VHLTELPNPAVTCDGRRKKSSTSRTAQFSFPFYSPMRRGDQFHNKEKPDPFRHCLCGDRNRPDRDATLGADEDAWSTAQSSHVVRALVPNSGYTWQLRDRLFSPYTPHLEVQMELPSVEMIKSFAAAGLGVSIISESFARDEVRSGKVKLLRLEEVELYRELGVAYMHRTLPRSPKPSSSW